MVKRITIVLFAGGLLALLLLAIQKSTTFTTSSRNTGSLSPGTSTVSEIPEKVLLSPSTIAHIPCRNFNVRPVAVFLESDPVARPLSGLESADLVIEMPVYGAMTRLLAFFQCEIPATIGAIRSARYDFLSLAKLFNPILVHFGGEKGALELLDQKILDTVNGLAYDGIYFVRDPEREAPHNAFTTADLLVQAREKLQYSATSADPRVFSFKDAQENPISSPSAGTASKISVKFGHDDYNVQWIYEPENHHYIRQRGDTYEIDRLTKKAVSTKNILVLTTTSALVNDLYNSVKVSGEGKVYYFVDGTKTEGAWYKKGFNDPLQIFDQSGKTIKLTPGKIWIEYIDQNMTVTSSSL